MGGCRTILAALLIAYALALGVFLVGTFGLFGNEPDPLAGLFLVPLGWPWNQAVDLAPEPSWPWLAAAAPLANLACLALVCRALRVRRQRTER
jgi:hypothetical protein